MAGTTVTRIENRVTVEVSRFECAECGDKFYYAAGFPMFCPECGFEFEKTDVIFTEVG